MARRRKEDTERITNKTKDSIRSPTFLLLNCVDLFSNFALQIYLIYRANGLSKWLILQPLLSPTFWGWTFVFAVCTILMTIFINYERFHRDHLVFWALKNMIAANAIGFHYSQKAFGFTALKAALEGIPASSVKGLTYLIKLPYWVCCWVLRTAYLAALSTYTVLHSSRYLIIIGLLILVICAIQQHTRALMMHKDVVEDASTAMVGAVAWHGSTVERALDSHGAVIKNAVNDHSRQITKASRMIRNEMRDNTRAIGLHGSTIERALDSHGQQIHKASRTITDGMRKSSLAMSSSMDRHALAIDKTIRGQNRQIEAGVANVVTAIHMSADRVNRGSENHGHIIAGAIRQVGSRRQQQRIEYGERTDRRVARLDNGLNIATAGLGLATTVVPLLGALAACNVM